MINGPESNFISARDLTVEMRAEVTRQGNFNRWSTSAQIWQLLRGGHSVEAEIEGSYIYVRLFDFRPVKSKPLGVNLNTFGYLKHFPWPPVMFMFMLPVNFAVYTTIAAQIQSSPGSIGSETSALYTRGIRWCYIVTRYTIHPFIWFNSPV